MNSFENVLGQYITEKKIEERNRLRDALLALDGKVYAKSITSKPVKELLILYSLSKVQADDEFFKKEAKPVLMVQRVKEYWLVEISVENGLLRVKDLAETDNWMEECINAFLKRFEAAFGCCDFAIAADFFTSYKAAIEG